MGKALRAPKGWETAQAWFGPERTVIGRITREGGAEGAQGRLVRWNLADGRWDAATWGTDLTGAVAVSGDGRTLVRCTDAWWCATVTPAAEGHHVGRVVEVKAPRVDDKRTDEATGERRRGFPSAILPPWCRESPKAAEALPPLHPHGLSTRNFVPAPERTPAPPPDCRRPPSTGRPRCGKPTTGSSWTATPHKRTRRRPARGVDQGHPGPVAPGWAERGEWPGRSGPSSRGRSGDSVRG